MHNKKVIKSDYEKPIQCARHNLKTLVLWAISALTLEVVSRLHS